MTNNNNDLSILMAALENPNGVNEDVWVNIVAVIGQNHPTVKSYQNYGGRYYLTNQQLKQLQNILPFYYNGSKFAQNAVPIDNKVRCVKCKGPYHPATGHAFNEDIVACHVCYGKFAAWQMSKNGWLPLTSRQAKKLRKKKIKEAKREEKEAAALAKRLAIEAANKEKIYGKPRDIQSCDVDT